MADNEGSWDHLGHVLVALDNWDDREGTGDVVGANLGCVEAAIDCSAVVVATDLVAVVAIGCLEGSSGCVPNSTLHSD